MNAKAEKIVCNTTAFVTAAILCVALAGCMVGPDYKRPQTIADTNDGYIYTGKHQPDEDIEKIDTWWKHFGDETTTQLVTTALANNNNLQASAARVLQAEALLVETRGKQLPEVSYNFGRTRAKSSFNFGGSGRFSSINTTFSQSVTVSYVADLFGKLKRQEKSAWADLFAAKANEQALTNIIISSVVKSRANIATIQRQLAITQANTDSWRQTVEIIERRYGRGLVGPLDVRLARENLEASKSNEIFSQQRLVIAQNALDALLARHPGSSSELPKTLPELPDLTAVPVGIPAYLLDRRPDVMAAELALRSASEQIGVSIAQLYPDLTLGASYGTNADRFGDAFKHQTEIYSATLNLAQPIFKGKQLKARVDFSKARYKELTANYAETVLTALREVEDALIKEEMLQKQLAALRLRYNEANAAEQLAKQRYLRGVERLLAVIETQRRRRIAENEINIVRGQLWAGRVDLFLALGGDWVSDSQKVESLEL
ncbi:MAG: efflux transporter outer membrane subunit [Planctomycetes bacterium]|nr:efflux transporter outer membrane subunit [Planctomycetota bacterium]